MPKTIVARYLLLPELKLIRVLKPGRYLSIFFCERVSQFEVCPKCATPSSSIYDHREVEVRDAPFRGSGVILRIKKKALYL